MPVTDDELPSGRKLALCVGIDTYRRLGFRLEGIDLSHYTNADYPDGEVAVFMKRRVGA